MQVCSWNILEEKVCNFETCFDIFSYYKDKDPSLFAPLPDEKTLLQTNKRVEDLFNADRKDCILTVLRTKSKGDKTIFCLQEVNPDFCEVIVKAFPTYKYKYGCPEPLSNPYLEGAAATQQGCLILSPFEITDSDVLYPFLEYPRPQQNPPSEFTSSGQMPYANPIVYAKINDYHIINTHYFAGGESRVVGPQEYRDLQSAKIIELLYSLPKREPVLFCSDFNRHIKNYPKLFESSKSPESSRLPLKIRNSTKQDDVLNRNGSVLRVFGNNFLIFEEMKTIDKINDYLIAKNIKNNGQEILATVKSGKYPFPRSFPPQVLNELKAKHPKFYMDYFYKQVTDEGHSIEGIWTNFKNIEIVEQSVKDYPKSFFHPDTGIQYFEADRAKSPEVTFNELPIYPTLGPTAQEDGCPSDHLPITAIITEGVVLDEDEDVPALAGPALAGGKKTKRYKSWRLKSNKYRPRRKV